MQCCGTLILQSALNQVILSWLAQDSEFTVLYNGSEAIEGLQQSLRQLKLKSSAVCFYNVFLSGFSECIKTNVRHGFLRQFCR